TDHPLDYAHELRAHVEAGTPTTIPIATLADYAINKLEKNALPNDNPSKDFIYSMDGIIFDHRRATDRHTLTQPELDQDYWQTFSSVLNIMTIGLDSNIRAIDIPEMSYCQGRVYTARDLHDDWKMGVINIPGEILFEEQLTAFSSLSEVQSNHRISAWQT